MKKIKFILSMLLLSFVVNAKDYNDLGLQNKPESNTVVNRVGNNDLAVTLPDFIFEGTNTKIDIRFKDAKSAKLVENNYVLTFTLNGQDIPVQFDAEGKGTMTHNFLSGEPMHILFEDFSYRKELNVISLWMIIAPFAIILLLITLRVLNQRAKNKVAKNTLKNIQTIKPQPESAEQNNAVKTKAEEEMLA